MVMSDPTLAWAAAATFPLSVGLSVPAVGAKSPEAVPLRDAADMVVLRLLVVVGGAFGDVALVGVATEVLRGLKLDDDDDDDDGDGGCNVPIVV